jgi:hypothetical protein
MEEAAKFREGAERLAPGTERDLLLKRICQAEQATQIIEWLARPNAAVPDSLGNLLKAPSAVSRWYRSGTKVALDVFEKLAPEFRSIRFIVGQILALIVDARLDTVNVEEVPRHAS